MLELLAVGAGSFTVALSGALMPGPLFTITITESARRGFQAGPLLMTGHSLLELILVVAIISGCGPYLKMPSVMAVIALFGGGFLVFMGLDMVRSAAGLSLEKTSSNLPNKKEPHPVLLGALASLSNPYWILWWATIGLGYMMTAMKFGMHGIAAFFLGHITADYAWYSAVSMGVSKGTHFIGDKSYQWIIRCCGVFLVFFGAWFLWSAKGFLMKASVF